MALTLSIMAKNPALDGLVDAIDVGIGSAASVKIYDSPIIYSPEMKISLSDGKSLIFA